MSDPHTDEFSTLSAEERAAMDTALQGFIYGTLPRYSGPFEAGWMAHRAYTLPLAKLCKHVYRNLEGDAVYCNATRELHYPSDHHFTAAST